MRKLSPHKQPRELLLTPFASSAAANDCNANAPSRRAQYCASATSNFCEATTLTDQAIHAQ